MADNFEAQAARIKFVRQARGALAIAEGRIDRPLSQEVFAARCGWTGSMQYKYESGAAEIGDHVLARVREVLIEAGVDPAWVTLSIRNEAAS
jgi:transcriptional regulator with XRE-family HTH domain